MPPSAIGGCFIVQVSSIFCIFTETQVAPLPMVSPFGPFNLAAFKTSTRSETFTHKQVRPPAFGTALAPSGPRLLFTDPKELLLRGFHLGGADLLSIISATANQQPFFSSKDFTCIDS